MAQVFLSYASEDRDRVRPLAEALIARGFDLWWDRALASGDDFGAVIQRELNQAKAVVVVWTHASVISPWVREEAGRARDDGRLLPLALDRVDLPLGFGPFQAEDFTKWSGSASAPQVELLEEALKAKLEGRGVDSASMAAKRRRLVNQVRLGSVLVVAAAAVFIAGNVRNVPFLSDFIPGGRQAVQTDRLAPLLELVRDGKLSPEQAIELARLLESQAFANAPTTQGAQAQIGANAKAGYRAPSSRPTPSSGSAPVAEVSVAEFERAARQTAREAWTELLAHPDTTVRTAAVQLRNPATLDQAMRVLWDYATAHPGPTQATIYRVCGAVGAANNHPLGLRALERARDLNPQNSATWRMLSFRLRRDNKPEEAQAAALVGEGLEAHRDGHTQIAEQRLERALPNLRNPEGRAFVEGQLGDAAARREDLDAAVRHYEAAYRLRERQLAKAPSASAAPLNVDAQKLVRALDRSGRTAEACRYVERAQRAGVDKPDAEVSQRCVRLQYLHPETLQAAPAMQQRANTQTAPQQGTY